MGDLGEILQETSQEILQKILHYTIFWRHCLTGRVPISHAGAPLSAIEGKKESEMQKFVLKVSMHINEINIKVSTAFYPGPKYNSQLNL